MSPTVQQVLACAPPEWGITEHGRRSMGRAVDFVRASGRALLEKTLGGVVGVGVVGVSPVEAWAAATVFTELALVRHLDAMTASGMSPGTRNRTAAAVLTLWRRAHRRGLLGPPPAGMYEREPRGRRRVLSPSEESGLMNALAEPYRSLAAFLLASGLRVGEALALEWRDLTPTRLEGGEWTVRVTDSKNGDARAVPGVRAVMPPGSAYRVLLAKNRGPFGGVSHSSFNHAFRAAKAAMGLEHDRELVPHSLRHTYATRLVVAGVPLSVVARLLGHRTVRTTMRYSHVSDEDAAEWVRRVSK